MEGYAVRSIERGALRAHCPLSLWQKPDCMSLSLELSYSCSLHSDTRVHLVVCGSHSQPLPRVLRPRFVHSARHCSIERAACRCLPPFTIIHDLCNSNPHTIYSRVKDTSSGEQRKFVFSEHWKCDSLAELSLQFAASVFRPAHTAPLCICTVCCLSDT